MLSENIEQQLLARYLDDTDLLWCHVPNGGFRHKSTAARLRHQGLKAGVPDILIFTRFVIDGCLCTGLAIELKRESGGTVSTHQKKWLDGLHRQGWKALVCHGHKAAIAAIENHYGNRKGKK